MNEICQIAPIKEVFIDFFDIKTIPFYCLGFLTFFIHIVTDLINNSKHKERHTFSWYFQDFLYALVSIIIGISFCYICAASKSITWIVSIVCGMFGSTIIRTLYNQKETISTKAVEKITDNVIDKTAEGLGEKVKTSITGNKENQNNQDNIEIENNIESEEIELDNNSFDWKEKFKNIKEKIL